MKWDACDDSHSRSPRPWGGPGSARLRGRTRHNKTVNFDGTAAAGELVDVEITGATSTTLSGAERLLSRSYRKPWQIPA